MHLAVPCVTDRRRLHCHSRLPNRPMSGLHPQEQLDQLWAQLPGLHLPSLRTHPMTLSGLHAAASYARPSPDFAANSNPCCQLRSSGQLSCATKSMIYTPDAFQIGHLLPGVVVVV